MKSSDGRFEYQDKDGEPLPDDLSLSMVGRFQYKCRGEGREGSHCSINIANAGYQIEKRNWKLTGTTDSPTITPSINCGDCSWHGYITDGNFENTSHQKETRQ